MISDEYQMKAACVNRDAAAEMTRAASEISEAVRQLQYLLADGYGGNGLQLLEELRKPGRCTVCGSANASEHCPHSADSHLKGFLKR